MTDNDPKTETFRPLEVRLDAEGQASESTMFELFDGTEVPKREGAEDLGALLELDPDAPTDADGEPITQEVDTPKALLRRIQPTVIQDRHRNLVFVAFGLSFFFVGIMAGLLLARLGV